MQRLGRAWGGQRPAGGGGEGGHPAAAGGGRGDREGGGHGDPRDRHRERLLAAASCCCVVGGEGLWSGVDGWMDRGGGFGFGGWGGRRARRRASQPTCSLPRSHWAQQQPARGPLEPAGAAACWLVAFASSASAGVAPPLPLPRFRRAVPSPLVNR